MISDSEIRSFDLLWAVIISSLLCQEMVKNVKSQPGHCGCKCEFLQGRKSVYELLQPQPCSHGWSECTNDPGQRLKVIRGGGPYQGCVVETLGQSDVQKQNMHVSEMKSELTS